jgi:flagellar motor component MotA
MNKFIKRTKKLVGKVEFCAVIGNGFGFLDDIIEMFSSVFIISNTDDKHKNKKIIYLEDYSLLSDVSEIGVLFVERHHADKIKLLTSLYTKKSLLILIEGNEPIDRLFSEELYRYGYRCISQQGYYHVWRKQ